MNIEAILGTVILLVLAVSVALWSSIIFRLVRGVDLLPFEPRRVVPWNAMWVAFALLIYLGLTAAVVLPVAGWLANAEKTVRLSMGMVATGFAHLAATAMIVLVLRSGSGATLFDLGWRGKTFLGDVRLGVLTFLAVAPPVYLLQSLLAQLNDKRHAVIEMLEGNQAPMLFAASTFVAVLVAPIAEEVLFRVVLQGWLERRWQVGEGAPHEITTTFDEFAPSAAGALNPQADHPFASPLFVSTADLTAASGQATETSGSPRLEILPILLSSIVFALFHVGQGLAPIALFFLALALGYIYQRTHRIVPCIVLHMLVNGTSMLLLWVLLTFKLQ